GHGPPRGGRIGRIQVQTLGVLVEERRANEVRIEAQPGGGAQAQAGVDVVAPEGTVIAVAVARRARARNQVGNARSRTGHFTTRLIEAVGTAFALDPAMERGELGAARVDIDHAARRAAAVKKG